jgi:hypothetical protein
MLSINNIRRNVMLNEPSYFTLMLRSHKPRIGNPKGIRRMLDVFRFFRLDGFGIPLQASKDLIMKKNNDLMLFRDGGGLSR